MTIDEAGWQERDRLARQAAEITPERLALWHDYPWTEGGESMLVNAEWHGPRCRTNVTRLYRDCDCSLVQAVVSVEVEAVVAHRLIELAPEPAGPKDIIVGVAESASWVQDQWPDEVAYLQAYCAACGHLRECHSGGGMCSGDMSIGGTECYCVRFPDAPDFEEEPDRLSMAHPSLARSALVQFGVHGSGCGVWSRSGTPSEPVDPRCTCGLSKAIRDCTDALAARLREPAAAIEGSVT